MAKRDRSASLTQLLTEATTDGPSPTPEPAQAPEQVTEPQKPPPTERTAKGSATKASKPGRGEGRAASPSSKRTRERTEAKRAEASSGGSKAEPADGAEATGEGHVRYSDGSYLRADGERRVALQLKMRPDDKQALKVQAAEAGLSPAEYVARLVREDAR